MKIKPKYMMATVAIHQLGDISSDEPDICIISEDEGTDYIGSWVFGLGFFGVKFPKATTRELTPEEVTKYQGMKLAMYSMNEGTKSYDCGSIEI